MQAPAGRAGGRPRCLVSVLSTIFTQSLLAHDLEGGAEALIILVAERDKTEGICSGWPVFLFSGQELHQRTYRAGRGVQASFSDGNSADSAAKFRQTSGE